MDDCPEDLPPPKIDYDQLNDLKETEQTNQVVVVEEEEGEEELGELNGEKIYMPRIKSTNSSPSHEQHIDIDNKFGSPIPTRNNENGNGDDHNLLGSGGLQQFGSNKFYNTSDSQQLDHSDIDDSNPFWGDGDEEDKDDIDIFYQVKKKKIIFLNFFFFFFFFF